VLCVDGGCEFGLVHAEWGFGSVWELRGRGEGGKWKVGSGKWATCVMFFLTGVAGVFIICSRCFNLLLFPHRGGYPVKSTRDEVRKAVGRKRQINNNIC
jgi:hypothetical protein